MIVRGIAQLARRFSGVNNPDSAWLLRPRHGADDSRAPRSGRQSVETAARRSVRGSPSYKAPRDYWPGKEALGRPATVCHAADSRAEPSDVLPDKVAASDANLAPHAS